MEKNVSPVKQGKFSTPRQIFVNVLLVFDGMDMDVLMFPNVLMAKSGMSTRIHVNVLWELNGMELTVLVSRIALTVKSLMIITNVSVLKVHIGMETGAKKQVV